MPTLREQYGIDIEIIAHKIYEVNKTYKKPMKDICDDALNRAMGYKYKITPHQSRLNFMEE